MSILATKIDWALSCSPKAKWCGMACVKYSASQNCVAASKGPVGKAAGHVSPVMFIQVEPCTGVPTGLLGL